MRTLLVYFLVVTSLTVFVSASFAGQIGNPNGPKKGILNQPPPHQPPPAPPKKPPQQQPKRN
jgi:hypothetical protein